MHHDDDTTAARRGFLKAAAGTGLATLGGSRAGAVLRLHAEPALPRPVGADPRPELRQVPHLQQHRRAGRHRHALGRRAGVLSRQRR